MKFSNLFLKYVMSPLMLFLIIGTFCSNVLIEYLQSMAGLASPEDSKFYVFLALGVIMLICAGYVISAYSYFYIGKHEKLLREQSFLTFAKHKGLDFLVTSVRAEIRVLLRMFLLIVPGVIEFVRLNFASANVVFNSKMEDPNYDPILDSKAKIPLGTSLFYTLFGAHTLRFIAGLIFGKTTFLSGPNQALISFLKVTTLSGVSIALICFVIAMYFQNTKETQSNG